MGTWDWKRVGQQRGPNPLWLTNDDRRVIAGRHFELERKPGVCQCCEQIWPCDTAQVLHDLEQTDAAFRRMVTMPF